jgi:D-beta-D-heptose 7-phosphate kinase/D-beta-D-heptose 1-phosphate adenosyltransferase
MELLAALRAVDVVFPFSEDTPLEVIRELRPDALVKGADYALEEIVGADLVRGWGGRVIRAPLAEGRSSSSLGDRLRSASQPPDS